jgi:ATP-dependent DNA helicase RecQ
MSETQIHQILKKYWGYDTFREKQEEIIQSTLDGKDTLALLPTGGGKSICFQVPAMAMEGICLVVSPLIALMEDQVLNLRKRGIKAMAISSAMSKKELDIALDNAAYGDFKFLYLSPERLQTELFKARLPKMNVSLLAIDEAHCISQWGYDFRPAYLNIAELRKQLPEVPVLALTATATPKVVDDIQERLEFKEKHVIQKSFQRKNLAYVVLKEENMHQRMLKVIKNVGGSGVVYCNRRLKCKQIAGYLQDHQISADYYHGGLDHAQRSKVQESWIQNHTQVVVATNAFGMGIDKADVRFVIHMDYPNSLEAYYQEAGRGGRDGKKAYAVMMVNDAQAAELKAEYEKAFPPLEEIKKIYLALCNFLQIPINGGEGQSFSFDLRTFAQRYDFDAALVYTSLDFLQKAGYLSMNEGFYRPSKMKFTANKEELYKFQVSHKVYDPIIKHILRSYGGMFEDYVRIDEGKLAGQLNMGKQAFVKILEKLHQMEMVDFISATEQAQIFFNKARVDQRSLLISKENYKDRKAIFKEKIDAVLDYTQSKVRCRSQILLAYFGEKDSSRCGICDICLDKNKMDVSELEFDQIVDACKRKLDDEELSLNELIDQLEYFQEEHLVKVLEYLMHEEKIIEESGKLKWKP